MHVWLLQPSEPRVDHGHSIQLPKTARWSYEYLYAEVSAGMLGWVCLVHSLKQHTLCFCTVVRRR